MEKKNLVFIATSLDGYIADKDGGLAWLDSIPEINTIDTGYYSFMDRVDALVMGRTTYETLCGFDIDWPYKKPVYLLSRSLSAPTGKFKNHVQLVKGSVKEVLEQIHAQGHHKLYLDGGKTIQSFLEEDLIDEMIITTIPILLGGGASLFGELGTPLQFKCVETTLFLDAIVQNKYLRVH